MVEVDWKLLRQILRELRLSRPGFEHYGSFFKASGIQRSSVERIENGQSEPGVQTILQWVTACGITITEFFNRLEPAQADTNRITIRPDHNKIHVFLEELLLQEDASAQCISENIIVFHRDYQSRKKKKSPQDVSALVVLSENL